METSRKAQVKNIKEISRLKDAKTISVRFKQKKYHVSHQEFGDMLVWLKDAHDEKE